MSSGPTLSTATKLTGLVVLVVAGSVVFVWTASIWLLMFAAVLVAVVLRSSADALARRTGLPPGWALLVVVLALLGAAVLAGLLLGPRLAQQAEDMRRHLPDMIDEARRRVPGLDQAVQSLDRALSNNGAALAESAGAALSFSLQWLLYVLVVIIAGLYLAVDPGLYVAGAVRLVAVSRRARAREVLELVGRTLRRFLVGRLVSMAAVGLLTGVGLALLDVPLAALLGTIAGLLTFVPYAGPIAASLPIALVALTAGSGTLLAALVFYTGVQSIEGFVITPLVQKKAVALPPVLTLLAELLMGVLFGPLGVVVSVPFAAALVAVVRAVYVEDHLEGGADRDG
jgi:predicted PurR-regulated permease PerM